MTTNRIEKLTDEHRATFPEWVDRWTAIGLRTGPLTEEEWVQVEAAARQEYAFIGKADPRVFLGVRSPLAAAIVVAVAQAVAPAAAEHFGRKADGAGVGAGVGDGVGAGGLQNAKNTWYSEYQGGNLWCSYNAWLTWFRDVGNLELKGDLWDRLEADNTMMLAGPSWWYENLCVVSDRPTVLHVENIDGINRLHCEDGPAIGWADGWGIYSWHGTQVPADLIEGDGWDTTRILREENAEIRRCAIERKGWDWFITQANLQQVGETVPDPGNPGQELALYDIPESIYDEPVRVLLCTNATHERDGSRHRFGLTVPGSISDPIAAAAWTFGLNPSEYRLLERAS